MGAKSNEGNRPAGRFDKPARAFIMRAMRLIGSLALVLTGMAGFAAAAPGRSLQVKMATAAGFELQADAAAGELTERKVMGGAFCEPPAPAEAKRHFAGRFPINQFSWTECAVSFVPAGNGAVTLKLTAPREEASPGVYYRQEVLWDGLEMNGASLTNGSFEILSGNRPLHWEGGGVANAGPVTPLHAINYGRTWDERSLAQTFNVQAGRTVRVRLFARAGPTVGTAEMRAIANRDTLAHQAARYYQRGVVVGAFLADAAAGDWGGARSERDFARIKAEGFDHIRLPVPWTQHMGPGPGFALDPAFLTQVDTVISNALKQRLFVIAGPQPYPEFNDNPLAERDRFLALWRQLSARYAVAHPGLALELLSEPGPATDTTLLNSFYQQALKIIRSNDLMRVVFIVPGRGGSLSELGKLWLPYDEDNVIVSPRCAEPYYFTHQSGWGAGPGTDHPSGIVFPGPPPTPPSIPAVWLTNQAFQTWWQQYLTLPPEWNPASPAAIKRLLTQAKAWSDHYGRPLHLGEFGCHKAADADSRARYCAAFRQAAEELKLGWALRDWNGGFGYWEESRQAPAPGLREALFPK